MVSILYRMHKTLSPTHKVNSLYVFDRLARAAKHQVDKQGLTGDLNQERGNCATFLLRVEGVLEGLFQDTASAGREQKVSVSLVCCSTDVLLVRGEPCTMSICITRMRTCRRCSCTDRRTADCPLSLPRVRRAVDS